MNFGVKQSNSSQDYGDMLLDRLNQSLLKRKLYLTPFNCGESSIVTRSVTFEKQKTSQVVVDFVSKVCGKKAQITLLLDDVPFFKKEFDFLEDTPTYFSYSKCLFITSGRHTLTIKVKTTDYEFSMTEGYFELLADGIKDEFNAQVSCNIDYRGDRYYLVRFNDGYYLRKNDLKIVGNKINFLQQDLPKKAKLYIFDDQAYLLYKVSRGEWILAKLTSEFTIGQKTVIATCNDCEFVFKTVDSGEAYCLIGGELYTFFVYNLFETPSMTQRTKVEFKGVNQRVKGVFVAPYDGVTNNEFVRYLIVWGVDAVVMALVSGEGNSKLTSVLQILSERDANTAFAIDNIFFVGANKNGLLTEYKVVLNDQNTNCTITKKRYCSPDTMIVRGIDGFIIYEDGEYFVA
ncbi:MAG: hypothetical protein IKV38_01285 [Clostridia bacterium]|nr:hypothetical protein [Clostridia bacterium]